MSVSGLPSGQDFARCCAFWPGLGMGCCLLRTGGGGDVRRGRAGRPAAGLGMLAVRSRAGTVGCPYWARSVATVRGSVGGQRLLLAFGNSLGGLCRSVAVREWVGHFRVRSWAGGGPCSFFGGCGPSAGEMFGLVGGGG